MFRWIRRLFGKKPEFRFTHWYINSKEEIVECIITKQDSYTTFVLNEHSCIVMLKTKDVKEIERDV